MPKAVNMAANSKQIAIWTNRNWPQNVRTAQIFHSQATPLTKLLPYAEDFPSISYIHHTFEYQVDIGIKTWTFLMNLAKYWNLLFCIDARAIMPWNHRGDYTYMFYAFCRWVIRVSRKLMICSLQWTNNTFDVGWSVSKDRKDPQTDLYVWPFTSEETTSSSV